MFDGSLASNNMKTFRYKLLDLFLLPLIYIGSYAFNKIKSYGINSFKKCQRLMYKKKIFPITDHYYEPLFRTDRLVKSLREDRFLPGIDFNIEEQLEIINKFNYETELSSIPLEKKDKFEYYYKNNSFESGDSEFLYSIIRYYKPRKIIEIGSGFSTLMSLKAIGYNRLEDQAYKSEIICIEPFEADWLEKTNVKVIRQKVEDIEINFFKNSLRKNDILFIDSSHIIRPQGDVLFEYLEILPTLKSGVLIHIHDIFTPKDYLDEWVKEKILFWNEQYLLEAFLCHNADFRIIGALNFLKHHYSDLVSKKFPILGKQPYREPGSFWIIKN